MAPVRSGDPSSTSTSSTIARRLLRSEGRVNTPQVRARQSFLHRSIQVLTARAQFYAAQSRFFESILATRGAESESGIDSTEAMLIDLEATGTDIMMGDDSMNAGPSATIEEVLSSGDDHSDVESQVGIQQVLVAEASLTSQHMPGFMSDSPQADNNAPSESWSRRESLDEPSSPGSDVTVRNSVAGGGGGGRGLQPYSSYPSLEFRPPQAQDGDNTGHQSSLIQPSTGTSQATREGLSEIPVDAFRGRGSPPALSNEVRHRAQPVTPSAHGYPPMPTPLGIRDKGKGRAEDPHPSNGEPSISHNSGNHNSGGQDVDVEMSEPNGTVNGGPSVQDVTPAPLGGTSAHRVTNLRLSAAQDGANHAGRPAASHGTDTSGRSSRLAEPADGHPVPSTSSSAHGNGNASAEAPRVFEASSRADVAVVSLAVNDLVREVRTLRQELNASARGSRQPGGDPSGNADVGAEADAETEGPVMKRTKAPKRRSAAANQLSKDVQGLSRLLMHRPSIHSSFHNLPTRQEVADFNPANGPACTIANFRPDMETAPGSRWNRSVKFVFVDHFVQCEQYKCRDRHAIGQAFATHLIHLRREFKVQQMSEVDRRAKEKEKNKDTRKYNLFHQRRNACMRFDDLRIHLDMLERLGIEGMSSDESDQEDGVAYYRVLLKPWRNVIVTTWLRVFDAFHRLTRFSDADSATRGMRPRLRIFCNQFSKHTAAKKGLPINTYRPQWMSNLSSYHVELLKVDRREYAFVHTPSAMALSQSSHGQPSRGPLFV